MEKKTKERSKRAYSPSELMRMKRPVMDFEGKWEQAFGRPATTGLWIIWGNSGNGKSSFTMQLAKYLCRFGKVFYNSIEEDKDNTFIKMLERNEMWEVDKKFFTCKLTLEELEARMNAPRSEQIYIIDSFQAGGFTTEGPNGYQGLVDRHPNKLIIFVSRADGNKPLGRSAVNLMYDAAVKIWVESFKAYCKGRFSPKPGVFYTIWEEGAARCSGGNNKINDDGNNEFTDTEMDDQEDACDVPSAWAE